MSMLTEKALQGYREYTKRTIAYARYKIGTTYYKTPIQDIKIQPDGKLAVRFMIEPKISSKVTISEVQLFDTNNDLWLSKAENLVKESAQEGFFYLFKITIKEGQVMEYERTCALAGPCGRTSQSLQRKRN